MNSDKMEFERLNLKIMRLKYEAQSVQYTVSERMRKKRQLRHLEKERSEWARAQNTRV